MAGGSSNYDRAQYTKNSIWMAVLVLEIVGIVIILTSMYRMPSVHVEKAMKKRSEDWVLPKVIAHRGASAQAPENTLAALRKAKALGAKWVEFDVRLDSHGEAIVFHDKKLHRTTNGRGHVAKTPYEVITSLDAGSWFGSKFIGEKVPTLADWLAEAASLQMGINLEMKPDRRGRIDLLADQVISNLSRYWIGDLPMPLISSLSVDCLTAMRERAPWIMLGYVMDRWKKDWQKFMTLCDCVSLHVNEQCLKPDRIKQIKAEGYRVLAYTLKDPRRAHELMDAGVDAIFCNDLGLLG